MAPEPVRPRLLPVELAPVPWPEVSSEDPIAEVARALVLNLRAAMADRSVREVASAAGLHHTTLLKVLAGRAWPDLSTVARLEEVLRTNLWPRRSFVP
ncbi:XRE family transcriptional regulator [Curtobacterium sp. MCBD17_021]|nr:XRE family transcriptional regulator [Curtobacterium sp. MCBD17_021]